MKTTVITHNFNDHFQATLNRTMKTITKSETQLQNFQLSLTKSVKTSYPPIWMSRLLLISQYMTLIITYQTHHDTRGIFKVLDSCYMN